MVIIKKTSAEDTWMIGHQSIGFTHSIQFKQDAASDTADEFNDVAPTSTVVNLGSGGEANGNDTNLIMYAFAEKQGYSKFGSFVGSSASSFVYLGFKPKFFLWKNSEEGNSTYDHWGMVDSERQTPNGATDGYIRASQTTAESGFSGNGILFLSNGIKFINTGRYNDNTGDKYIFMAFAEDPFVSSSGVPGTAG